jgi:homopolymeric O-antigen transport system permease protein
MIAQLLSVRGNIGAIREVASVVRQYRNLLLAMTQRELAEQYTGQVLGNLWLFVHPLAVMALFVFLFAYVFKTKVGGTRDMPLDYTTYLLSGLIPWMALQQAMARGSVVLTARANLVKQVVFPIEILPPIAVLAGAFPSLVGFVALVVYVVITQGLPPATYLLLPLLMLMQLSLSAGAAYMLAAIGVFMRDTKDFVQIFSTYGVYVLPIFYLPIWVPPPFRPLLYANPFSYVIWCYQDALYFGRFQHPIAWAVFALESVVVLLIGYRVFRRLKPFFGNVL